MLTIQRMKQFPGERVVFLAPTKPLAEQHIKSFKKYLPELFADLQLFTGSVKAEKRKKIVKAFGELYGVSTSSIYRALRNKRKPKGLCRSDSGVPRVMTAEEMEKYCQVIMAMKLRTLNKKGRHLSTSEAIRLLETVGVVTPDGHIKAPKGVLKKTTVNVIKVNRETLIFDGLEEGTIMVTEPLAGATEGNKVEVSL